MLKNIVRWVSFACALSMMGVIFWFSSKSGDESTLQTHKLVAKAFDLLPFLQGVTGFRRLQLIYDLTAFFRMAAHFGLFFLLGIFWETFILTLRWKKLFLSLCVFAFCALYAVSDEVHQLFVKGRVFELFDIVLDVAGSAAGICLALLLYVLYRKIKDRAKVNYK